MINFISILLLVIGLYIVSFSRSFFKKLLGLALFQSPILVLYLYFGIEKSGTIPIISEGVTVYHNPIPQVLMLTAIVVGISTTAVGLSLIRKIYKETGTLDEKEIIKILDKKNEGL